MVKNQQGMATQQKRVADLFTTNKGCRSFLSVSVASHLKQWCFVLSLEVTAVAGVSVYTCVCIR